MATLSPTDRDYLIRTVIGEAARQPRLGQAAVAHTVLNRRKAGRWGDSVQDVVLAKNQFEPWGTRADELYSISPESDVYQQTGQLVDKVAAGHIPDPTQGGLFFLNPENVRQRRGGTLPNWAQNETASIGQHTFYRGPGNEDTDMAVGTRNPRRGQVYQPEVEPGTGNISQAGRQTGAMPMPTAPSPNRSRGGPDIPGRPSKNDLSMAQALMQAGQRDAQNTRGTGLGLAGALAQQLSGAYMAGQYEDKKEKHNSAMAEALASADNRDAMTEIMLQSGDEGLRNVALQSRLARPKDNRPAAVREFEYAQRNPEFAEYRKQTSQPAVVMKGETAYRKERGSQLAKEYGQIQTDAQKARSRIGQLRQIDGLLSDPAVYTGSGAETINSLKRVGKTLFGMDFQGVDKADAARRVVNEMALSFKSDLPGPMSDSDRQFLQEIPPNIGDTAQGRKLLVELMKQKEQRKVELARLAREYARENGRLDDGWYEVAARYAEANPMFDEDMMERAKEVAGTAEQRSPYAGSYPTVNNDADFDALEPGSYFFDPNGDLRRKPE